MWIPSSMFWPPNRRAAARLVAVLLLGATPAQAQLAVYDPTNYVQNALQAARQLQSVTNEVQMLMNQAKALAASPYSHLLGTSQTLRDITELSRSIRGVAGDITQLERQFEDLYPTAVKGLDPTKALEQIRGRNEAARQTAQDLARAAAELERLSAGRQGRLEGALSASEGASGQTAAIQSSTQVLAVLAEDLGSMRTILLAQSRLMAEDAARRSAERAAAVETRRQFYDHAPSRPAPPAFDPFPNARN